MTKASPEISVIMPVYNTREDYLREAVESIVNQTYPDFELIIVDDASEADVSEVIESYKDKRIFYYRREKNEGAAAARNFAIDRARGKYIAFMDSDDVSLPERFEKQIGFLKRHPEIGCLGTKVGYIGNDVAGRKEIQKPVVHEEIEHYLIFMGCVFCQSSVVLKKEVLDKNNIRYQSCYVPAEDYALWLDLIGKTKFAVLEEKLVLYRSHTDNISHRENKKQGTNSVRARLETLQKHYKVRQLSVEVWTDFFNYSSLNTQKEEKIKNELDGIIAALEGGNNPFLDISSFLNGCVFILRESENSIGEKLAQLIVDFERKGYPVKNAKKLFRKKFKKQYYHTRNVAGQLKLMRSPLNRLLEIPLIFRIFCFVTRGVL